MPVIGNALQLGYPTGAELTQIAQDKMPRLIQDRPIFDLLPVKDADDYVIRWDQKDNYEGLQQLRGLDGQPSRVANVGGQTFEMQPGVYGEYMDIPESEITRRRQYGTFNVPIDIADKVMENQDLLLQRRLDRIEYIGWQLLVNGIFTVNGPNGLVHTDAYALQQFASTISWSNAANSTPLADFRSVKLLHRGHSVTFNSTSKAYMNLYTANQMVSNVNADDLYGRRTTGLATANSVSIINSEILMKDDLPTVVIYDEGYISDGLDGNTKGTFIPFIPNGVCVIVGRRPAGQTVGAYRMVRNANNPGAAPGPYMHVSDNADRGEVPRNIRVHDGHNGGPVIWYPSAIVSMNVG